MHDAFVNAARQAGYPVTGDYNGEQQEGFGPMEQTVWRGQRWSAANAYLKPALKSPNCTLEQGVVSKVLFSDGRATGVELVKGGQTKQITARREVILAASSINSQDHLELYLQYASLQPITLYKYWNLFGKAWVGAQWLFARKGPGASNQFESAGFIRSNAGIEYPDIQCHFLPIAVRYDGQAADEGRGFQAHVGPMRSKSRGRVSLRSADPAEAPSIRFNYMSHPDDWTEFRACIRLTREIFAQKAMAPFVKHEIQPGADPQSDEALDGFIREHVESAFHPCGTCRMGRADDPDAVVDAQGRVIGVDGLRVVDSSVFPRITTGNLNGPSIMTGEKMSDHILGRDPLPRANARSWINPNWETSQR